VRIDDFEGGIQPSDWLELSENRCARATSSLAAVQRIGVQPLTPSDSS
jgi:hypothetical protein